MSCGDRPWAQAQLNCQLNGLQQTILISQMLTTSAQIEQKQASVNSQHLRACAANRHRACAHVLEARRARVAVRSMAAVRVGRARLTRAVAVGRVEAARTRGTQRACRMHALLLVAGRADVAVDTIATCTPDRTASAYSSTAREQAARTRDAIQA
jgi:hypothetical protein